MAENTQEVNPFEQKLKPLLREGEQFVTNAPKKSERLVSRINEEGKIEFEKEESESQLAGRLASYGGWESLRVLDTAYDINGNPIDGMVALVGSKKKGK